MSRFWRLAAPTIALGVAATWPARAACPLQENVLSVQVTDDGGQAVAGANVEATWRERDGTQEMRIARETDAAGQARLVIQFDPYSGRSFGGRERCEAKLDRVALRTRKAGFADASAAIEPDAFDEPVAITLKAR